MSIAGPAVRRWTVAEYHRAAETGIFGPEERLELIDGEIFRMSPQNGPHATGSTLTESAVQEVFRAGYVVPGAGEYRTITRHDEKDTVSPLAAPKARLAVRDLLP